MRLAFLIRRQGANRIFPNLVNENHKHAEWQRGDSVMHEDVIPGSKGDVEGLEVANQYDKHDLSG